MATFRSCACWLLNIEYSNYLIYELLIVIFSPLSLIMAYCANHIYNRYNPAIPQGMYVNRAPLNDFLVKNLNLSFLISLFIMTFLGFIFIRPTLIVLTTYIINNLPSEVCCIARIVLKFLIDNSIFIVLSGLTVSIIIKPIISLNYLASINNTRPVMANCKSTFSNYLSPLMVTFTAASMENNSETSTLKHSQIMDKNVDKIPYELRIKIWEYYQNNRFSEHLSNPSQQLIRSIFDYFNMLHDKARIVFFRN